MRGDGMMSKGTDDGDKDDGYRHGTKSQLLHRKQTNQMVPNDTKQVNDSYAHR